MHRHSVFFALTQVASIYFIPYKTADISGSYLFRLAVSHRARRLNARKLLGLALAP